MLLRDNVKQNVYMDNNQSTKMDSKSPAIRTGTDDFKNLLLNSDVFVDKSLFVKDIIEDSGYVILITRPRRWGKSLNMNMLKRFFEIEVDSQGNILPLDQRISKFSDFIF